MGPAVQKPVQNSAMLCKNLCKNLCKTGQDLWKTDGSPRRNWEGNWKFPQKSTSFAQVFAQADFLYRRSPRGMWWSLHNFHRLYYGCFG